jgi:hypothetical protein
MCHLSSERFREALHRELGCGIESAARKGSTPLSDDI